MLPSHSLYSIATGFPWASVPDVAEILISFKSKYFGLDASNSSFVQVSSAQIVTFSSETEYVEVVPRFKIRKFQPSCNLTVTIELLGTEYAPVFLPSSFFSALTSTLVPFNVALNPFKSIT